MYVTYMPYSKGFRVSGVWTYDPASAIHVEPIKDGGTSEADVRWSYSGLSGHAVASTAFAGWSIGMQGYRDPSSPFGGWGGYGYGMADDTTPRGWSVTVDDSAFTLGMPPFDPATTHITVATPAGFGAGWYHVQVLYTAFDSAGANVGTYFVNYELLIEFELSVAVDPLINAVTISLTPNTQALDLNGYDPSPDGSMAGIVGDIFDTHFWWGALIGLWPATGYVPGTTPGLVYIMPNYRLTRGYASGNSWWGSEWVDYGTPDTYQTVINLEPGQYVFGPANPGSLPDSGRPGKLSAYVPRYVGPNAITITVPGPPKTDGTTGDGGDDGVYILRSDNRLAVPQLAIDDTTGRLMVAVGMTDFQFFYQCGPNGAGAYKVWQSGATKFVPRPIYFTVATGAGDAPLFAGAGTDIGIVPDNSSGWGVLFPDGVQALAGQGKVRVGVLHYQAPTSATIIAGPAWRVSTDGGKTWADSSETTSQADTPYWLSHAGETLPGSRRQRRTMQGAGLPVVRQEGYNGASGWTNTRGDLMYVNRFPIYEHRGPTGPFANRWGPWAKDPGDFYRTPYGDNPGRQECHVVITHDGNNTRVTQPAPTLGSVDTSITNVPGYPFAGEWCGQFTEGRFMFGAPGLGSAMPPSHPSGGLAWADGAANGTAYLFCVAIMRMPIPRNSFAVDTPLAGILKEATDTEDHALNEGIDCGHTTCIVYAWTSDQGKTFGDLRVIKTDAGVVLIAAETARIDAVTLPGGRLVLAVSDNGTVTIYTSDDGQTWAANCKSNDGGATWDKP